MLSAAGAGDTLLFARILDSDCTITAVTRSKSPQQVKIALDGLPEADRQLSYRDVLSGRVYKPVAGYLNIELAAEGSCLLVPLHIGSQAA
jgi:hypothetical protein